MEAQINDFKELEPSKKEEAGELNLFGFNACGDRRKAQEQAWEHVEKSTQPCIFQIEFQRTVDHFRLDLAVYNPYYQTE